MTIFATDTPMHPDDREAWWVSMKRAYLNNERAVNHFAVRPVYRINLATNKGRARSALKFAGEVIGGAAFILLAFAFVVLLGLRMEIL